MQWLAATLRSMHWLHAWSLCERNCVAHSSARSTQQRWWAVLEQFAWGLGYGPIKSSKVDSRLISLAVCSRGRCRLQKAGTTCIADFMKLGLTSEQTRKDIV